MTRTGAALLVVLAMPSLALAQSTERLTLERAIVVAVRDSHVVDAAMVVEEQASLGVRSARTRLLPSLSTEAQVSRLLRPVDIVFPVGAFGTFDGTGPVPSVDTYVTTPVQTNLVLNASVSQPLTGLWKERVAVRQSQTSLALAGEDVRAARLDVAHQVRRVYYGILQNVSALEAADANGLLLAEAARVVRHKVVQKVALRPDGLEMDARLAQNELTRLKLSDAVTSGKEELNRLLGRDVTTEFEVESIEAVTSVLLGTPTGSLDDRPDIRQARMRVHQAALGVQQARADRLPDVSLTVQTISPVNIDGAPRNITSAGIQVKWEPFDWGRRSQILASKRLSAARAERVVREAEDSARAQINQTRRTLVQARATLRVAALSQVAAREQARIRTTQYQAQAALLTDVLQAQASLAESTTQYQQTLLSLLMADADLSHALGEERIP